MWLVLILLVCFAQLGTWVFGGYRPEFQDFGTSVQTLFEMMFGGFVDNWTQNMLLEVYSVSFLVVLFLLVLNFLLAIIVEAYMKVSMYSVVGERSARMPKRVRIPGLFPGLRTA